MLKAFTMDIEYLGSVASSTRLYTTLGLGTLHLLLNLCHGVQKGMQDTGEEKSGKEKYDYLAY